MGAIGPIGYTTVVGNEHHNDNCKIINYFFQEKKMGTAAQTWDFLTSG